MPSTIAFNYCFQLLLSTIAFNFCLQLLLSTNAFNYCFQLLLSTIAFNYCSQLLLSIIVFHYCFQLDPAKQLDDRPVRAAVPILVSMTSGPLTVREFTLDLSEGGMFLLTDRICPPGSLATLTFRASSFDDPFRIKAKIVRAVPGDEGQGPAGLGIEFIDLTDHDRKRLQDLVEGVRSGSIADALRKSIKGEPATDRGRVAPPAGRTEGDAGTGRQRAGDHRADPRRQPDRAAAPARVSQGRGAPREAILRNKGLPTKVLMAIHNEPRWMKTDELRLMYCAHPAAPLQDVMEELQNMPVALLDRLSKEMAVRPPIRTKAAHLVKQSGWVPRR